MKTFPGCRLLKALSELMPPVRIGRWVGEPNESLDGQTPVQVMERREANRLSEMTRLVNYNVAN